MRTTGGVKNFRPKTGSVNASGRLPEPEHGKTGSIASGWKARLLRNKRGGTAANVANALTALRHAPEWKGVLHFNASALVVFAQKAPPFESAQDMPFSWADEHDVLTAAWLQGQDIAVNKEIAGQAVRTVGREHPFHPIRNYLDSLKWDGTKRIDGWLTAYLGADPSDYMRAVGTRWLIGAVARVYEPGVKLDTCLVLEGLQGSLKSTALRALAGDDFFTDDIAELGSKDSVMQTRGVWIIELPELDSMARAEASRIKAFVSRQVDRIRPPYGRHVIEAPRECVFVGTVNHDTYLKDETGGRRFWPVKVGIILLARLRRDRDQLWAEASERYRAGDMWWLDSEALMKAAAEEVNARYVADPWQDIIDRGTSGRENVSTSEVLTQCLNKPKDTWTQRVQNRVACILKAKNWERYQQRTGPGSNAREWRYRRVTGV